MNPAKKDATEAVYRAICRSSVLDPTMTDGKIYVRIDGVLYRVDIKKVKP